MKRLTLLSLLLVFSAPSAAAQSDLHYLGDEFKGLRITPNVYTTLKELDRFCEVMVVARKGLPTA